MYVVTKRFRVDPAYPFAKSFAERGALLKRRFIEELADSKDLNDLVNALRATPYSDKVSAIAPPLTGIKIEHALRRSLIELHHRYISTLSNPSPLDALFMRHIARNLKTVLRSLAAGKSHEEVSRLVDLRAEELVGMRDIVVKAYSASSLGEGVGALASTPFGGAMTRALQLYEKTKDPAVFDVELDRVVSQWIGSGVERCVRRERREVAKLVFPIIEQFIVTAVLRAKIWELTSMEIRGLIGEVKTRIPNSVIEAMVESKSIEEALTALSLVRSLGIPIPTHGDEASAIRAVEDGFRRRLVEDARKTFLTGHSVMNSIISSLFLKENEVANLVAIAVGIEEGVPPQRIIDRLVFI